MASASDPFDGTAALSASWTVDNGTITIVSGQADATTVSDFNRARYTGTPMDTSDNFSEAVVPNSGVNDKGGVTFRQASATYTCYQFVWVTTSSVGIKLRSVSGGAETELATVDGNYSVPKTLKGEAVGSTIKGILDGVEVISVTNTAVTTGLYTGISIYNSNGLWNSWNGGDVSAAAAPDAVIHQAIYRGRELR